ncbi:MAG: WecB/TagA/CpsF family glycosyltransferase [Propionibacteriaceae bacterium]|nr:WecB/TagA/CpsF family glycosyltransferase [Propionibacteriaceae bacterium]
MTANSTGQPRRITMGTVAIDLARQNDVAALVDRALAVADHPTVALASVNLDHIHHFATDGPSHGQALVDTPDLQWKVLLDGTPIAATIKLRLHESWPLLRGSDLLPILLDQAERKGYSVGFLGGMPTMHRRLKDVLAKDYARLRVVGYWAPERAELTNPESSAALLRQIKDAGVEILVVGLGKPRQEIWIQDHAIESGAKVQLAFGASADFLAGVSRRAPKWMSRVGLEWLYRLAKEPRRLSRRYLIEGPQAAVHMLRYGPRDQR